MRYIKLIVNINIMKFYNNCQELINIEISSKRDLLSERLDALTDSIKKEQFILEKHIKKTLYPLKFQINSDFLKLFWQEEVIIEKVKGGKDTIVLKRKAFPTNNQKQNCFNTNIVVEPTDIEKLLQSNNNINNNNKRKILDDEDQENIRIAANVKLQKKKLEENDYGCDINVEDIKRMNNNNNINEKIQDTEVDNNNKESNLASLFRPSPLDSSCDWFLYTQQLKFKIKSPINELRIISIFVDFARSSLISENDKNKEKISSSEILTEICKQLWLKTTTEDNLIWTPYQIQINNKLHFDG